MHVCNGPFDSDALLYRARCVRLKIIDNNFLRKFFVRLTYLSACIAERRTSVITIFSGRVSKENNDGSGKTEKKTRRRKHTEKQSRRK